MPIDFHAPAHRGTHGGRDADASWRDAVRAGLDPAGLDVADVGCGAGVYSRAWSELGAASVVGVDSSAVVLSAAEEEAGGTGSVRFVRGDAAATGLPGASVDVVFERAPARHVPDLRAGHPHRDAYLEEIRQRRGRSILHELDDREVARLVDVLADRLPAGEPVVETDRWTLWTGALPA